MPHQAHKIRKKRHSSILIFSNRCYLHARVPRVKDAVSGKVSRVQVPWVRDSGFELLQNICTMKDNNFIPEDVKEYQYIELADIGKSGNITGCTVAQGKELPTREGD
jgi:hypothetical protein